MIENLREKLINKYKKDIVSYAEKKLTGPYTSYYKFLSKYEHTKRVLNWTYRLTQKEEGNIEIIELAALLHDIGYDIRTNAKIDHQITSAHFAKNYLNRIKQMDKEFIKKVVYVIETHSNKKQPKETLNSEQKIMMDADMLDETGALGILITAMKSAYKRGTSYLLAYNRMLKFQEKYYLETQNLKTKYGLEIYKNKVKLMSNFIKSFEYEYGLTENDIGGIL